MNRKKCYQFALSAIIGFSTLSTPLFAGESIIPKNINHFEIKQTAHFLVFNNISQPGIKSTFDVTVLKDRTHWNLHWTAENVDQSIISQESSGKLKLHPLKNGSFEFNGHVTTVTQFKDGKKKVEHFDRYNKIFYPIPNSKNDYTSIAHLYSKEGELISIGQAHFVIPEKE